MGADTDGMDGTLNLILGALAIIFLLAVAVAWWEHLVRSDRRQGVFVSTPASRALTVDVVLDDLGGAPIGGSDQPERRAALDGAMSRMARRGTERRAPIATQGWAATAPMVAPGSPSSTQAHAETTPGG